MSTQAWILQWWDSLGRPQESEPFTDRDEAEQALAYMDIRQEARLVLVYINQ